MPAAALAIPDLAAFAALLLALVILYNLQALTQLLASIFNLVPVIGGSIAGAIQRVAGGAISASISWAKGALGGLVSFVWTSIKWVASLFQRLGEAVVTAAQAYLHVVTSVVPAASGVVAGFVTQLYHQALAYTDQAVTALHTLVAGEVTAITGVIDQTAGGLANFATTLYHQALTYVDQTAGRLAAFATTLYHQAIAYVDQTAGAIRTWVGGEIATVAGDVQTLEREVTGTLAPEIAGIGTIVATLTQTLTRVEECTSDICATGSGPSLGGLGKILQELAPLIADGALFALVAYAAAEPEQAAHDLDLVAGGLVSGAADLLAGVTGVRVAA